MAAVDSSLASQCMDFCHALASQNKSFTFSLTIGSTFAFSLDTKESLLTAAEAVKRKSPSAIRRNARRRAEFLKKRSEPPSSSIGSQVAAGIIDVTLATKDDLQASAHQVVLNSSETVAVKEAEAPANAPSELHHHPSPSPSSERRQVITVGRERVGPTFSQLDGDPPSSPHPSPVRRSDCGMVKRCSFETNQIALRAGYTRKDCVRHGETSSDAT